MTISTDITPSAQRAWRSSPTSPPAQSTDSPRSSNAAVASTAATPRTKMRPPWVPTATGQPEREQIPPTWRNLPAAKMSAKAIHATGLAKWEGRVVEVDGDTFTAELFPIDQDGMAITADFDLELFGSDAEATAPGDVFYLSVRTVKEPGTRPTRTESLRLRRLGRITPQEVQSIYVRADALMESLDQLFD